MNDLLAGKTSGGLVPTIRRLHLGGRIKKEGWEIFNVATEQTVQHVGDARDLSRFPDATFGVVYASHLLEHFDYMTETLVVLAEWHRVLIPGGLLFLAVPDLVTICSLLSRPGLSFDDQVSLMRMIYGANIDPHDHHRSGWTPEMLSIYLQHAGFLNPRRATSFGIFSDTSELTFLDTRVSLNVMADKPK